MKIKYLFIIGMLTIGFLSCSHMTKPTQMEVLTQFESVNTLDKAISEARTNEVDSYAPLGFAKAEIALKKAIKLAQDGEKEKAVTLSKESLGTLRQAQEDAAQAKEFMWEVSDIRQKAVKAGAVDIFKDDFANAEMKFHKANAMVEKGNVETAKEQQVELLQLYSELEKNALDKGLIEIAQLAFKQAKKSGAEKYAPKYYNKAKKELNLALEILDTDRTRTEKANEHAALAAKWARNAGHISDLVKTFTLKDFSYEDTVVWYWQQLETVYTPFNDKIDFEQPNHYVIESIKKKISDLITSYADSQEAEKKIFADLQLIVKKQQDYVDQLVEDQRKEISKLENTQSANQRALAKQERMERATKQKFAFTQSLFQTNEAQVYRKGDNILISANGFYFPSGEDEIQSSNFALLNKILSSIHQFPDATVEISGHTDALGAKELNIKLSEKRAKNVANFITNVGQISLDKVMAKGYGDTKPIASNKTKEGRAQNRRIDVTIVNK